MNPVYDRWGVSVHQADCLDVLRGMPDNSVPAVVCDPPSGINFMATSWDSDRGGRHRWVEWLTERMAEALRVLAPGGHALVWGMPRTSHWTAWALEDAGFEIRDCIVHLFGNGFPKSLDVGKAIDKAAGVEREVVGTSRRHGGGTRDKYAQDAWTRTNAPNMGMFVTAPATDAAREWDGWHTALKPASEHWWLCRKPLSGTVAQTVLEHGTGALNIAACRTAISPAGRDAARVPMPTWVHSNTVTGGMAGRIGAVFEPATAGRWPTNALFSHSPLVDPVTGEVVGDACAEGCVPGCAVAELDRQSGVLHSQNPETRASRSTRTGVTKMGTGASVEYADHGGASRFFPCFRWEAKAPPAERPRVAGKAHPAVKPVDLMRWLCRLVTPPGGTVLDLFAGTGTTGQAARAEGFKAILIEDDPGSIPLIVARLDALPKTNAGDGDKAIEAQLDLFSGLDGAAS